MPWLMLVGSPMKKKVKGSRLLKLLTLSLILAVSVQDVIADSNAPFTPPFFKVTKSDQKAFLLGTVHSGIPPEKFPLHIFHAFGQSSVVVSETNLAPAADGGPSADLKNILYLPEGQSLSTLVPNDVWTKLAELGISDRLRPWVASMQYSAKIDPRLADPGIDQFLQKMASQYKKTPVYLEDLGQQAAVFGSQETQIKSLVTNVRGGATKSREQMDHLIEAYSSGDHERIYNFVHTLSKSFGHSDGATVESRNLKWITKIETAMTQGRAFIFVGAVHLGGGNGLVAELRKLGYRVEACDAVCVTN